MIKQLINSIILAVIISAFWFIKTSNGQNPSENSKAKLKIAIIGNTRDNVNNATTNIIDILQNKITDWNIIIHTGDFTTNGTDNSWKRSLDIIGMKQIFVRDKFYMCTGNNDANQSTWDKYTAGVLPVNTIDSTTHFYTIRKNNVVIVFCDDVFTDSLTMQGWLNKVLKDVKKEDILIGVWHIPSYDDLSYKDGNYVNCMQWLKIIYQYGGDFVISGDANIYERTKPLLPDGVIDEKTGMVHLINGAGGANYKSSLKVTNRVAFTQKDNNIPVITFLSIFDDTINLQTIDVRPESKLKVIDEASFPR